MINWLTNDWKQEQETPNKETQEGQGKNKETRVQNPDIKPDSFTITMLEKGFVCEHYNWPLAKPAHP